VFDDVCVHVCACRWRGTAFPTSFSAFLHPYLSAVAELTAAPGEVFDARAEKLYADFAVIAVQLGMLHPSASAETAPGTADRPTHAHRQTLAQPMHPHHAQAH
jgi:hypothetical protein